MTSRTSIAAPELSPPAAAPGRGVLVPTDLRAITVSARVHAALREQIVGMRLQPGAALAEKEICEAFAVSRTPVREALLRLAEEGLVHIVPQVGTFVSFISLASVSDAMVIRQALERVSVREAALRAGPAERAELGRILAAQRACAEAHDAPGFHATDEALHRTLTAIAGRPNLWRVIKRENVQVDRFRLLTLPLPGRLPKLIEQHARVVEAVNAGDPDAAEAAMESHLAGVLPSLDAVVAANPQFFEPAGQGATARPRRLAARG